MGTTFRTHVNPSSRSKETENFCRTRPIHKRAVIRARLRSGRASEQEVELTLFGAGWVASDSDRWRERLALVHIDDEWKLAIPSTWNFVRSNARSPMRLPRFSARFNPAGLRPK